MGGKGNSKGKGKAASKGNSKPAKGAGKDSGKGKGSGGTKWVVLKPWVLVTGASGFLATNVIKALLAKNYRVRGTVRSLTNEATVGPLKKLFPKLELVEADLLGGADSFEKAMAGCEYVMHCASPFKIKVDDPQKDLVDPALKGTEAVMTAALKAGVKRVVLTSSIAAMCFPPSLKDGQEVSEADWNSECSLEKGPYLYSKTLAEKKAWEMVKDKEGISLATIAPAFILGPMLSSRVDGESVEFIKGFLEGTSSPLIARPFPSGVVDVRDVAVAHVSAMEIEAAGGKRFLACHETAYSGMKLANMIRDKFKAYPIPSEGEDPAGGPKFNISQIKEVLKWKPRPIEVTFKDMANAAIKVGVVQEKVLLKKPRFGSVAKLNPESSGYNVNVKVVSKSAAEDTKDGKVQEVVAGDSTGIVTMRLLGDEVGSMEDGQTYEVRNASVRMVKGHIRLQVGKWGKISKYAGDKEVEPNSEKDMSATEYELVK